MDRLAWPTALKAVVGILVAAFVAGTVLLLVLQLNVLGEPPAETEDFLDDILATFQWEETRWPLEFAGTALFAVGFAALGMLGPLLARLVDADDNRGLILSASLLLAGGLGVGAELLWIGAKPVATSPQYCDCGFLAEEIMSRLMALNIIQSIMSWLINGATIAAAVGAVVAARIGVRAGMPGAWAVLSYVLAALVLVVIVLSVLGAYPFDLIGTVIVAAVVLPAWAIWIALRADGLQLGGPDTAAD